MARGYKKVYNFIGGVPKWRFFNFPMTEDNKWRDIKVAKIPPEKFQQILSEEQDIFLLDVRSLDAESLKDEKFVFKFNNSSMSGSYIKGALHCPLLALEENYHFIPKDRKVIITDWIMKQSIIAAKFLSSKGYEVVGVLKGGSARWQTEQMPLIQSENKLHKQLLCD